VNTFLAHLGAGTSIDLDYTLRQSRLIRDVVRSLPRGSEERAYFESDRMQKAFPDGTFNVWGVPAGAKEPFDRTNLGDVVLFSPSVSRDGGCVLFFGIVKLVPRMEFPKASRVLWRESGPMVYPHLFFFDAEIGMITWYNFMRDIGYSPDWNPRGWYVRLDRPAYRGTHNVFSYLDHLRTNAHFKRVAST